MPFKHNAARRHRIPKTRYRIQNWPAYEAGLKRRGDLTLWLDEAAITGWQAPRRTTPGGQAVGVIGAPPTPTQPPQGTTGTEKSQQASRIGKRAVTFYVSPDAFRQLGVLSAQSDRTVQSLMQEALDFLFQHHGVYRIAKE